MSFEIEGQTCSCDIYIDFLDSPSQVPINHIDCFERCKILIESISLIHKLHDINYWEVYNKGTTRMLSNMERIYYPVNSTFESNKKELIENLNLPLLLDFMEKDTIFDSIVLKEKIVIQKVIIDNDINILPNGTYRRISVTGGNEGSYIKSDTIYIIFNMNKTTILSDRVYYSEIRHYVNESLLRVLWDKSKPKHISSLVEVYERILKLRRIKFKKIRKNEFELNLYGNIKKIKLNRKNIKLEILKLINGNINY